jgi:hypothetical protein
MTRKIWMASLLVASLGAAASKEKADHAIDVAKEKAK